MAGSRVYVKDPKPEVYGIAATSARLDDTNGVAVDAAGNLLIATSGNMILKVTASTGLITVPAGTGEYGSSSDGVLATSARISYLSCIALDQFGNIFVAESDKIRKITLSTGIITTVAGTGSSSAFGAVDNVAATSTTLRDPQNVAIDAFGNIFITDSGYNRIRKVTASTGIITTIAGNGKSNRYRYEKPSFPALGVAATASNLGDPKGVAVDMSGNVFFAVPFFNSIYKVAASTGILTLVAGTNNRNYDYNGENILSTAAFLSNPIHVTSDALSNIYFSDRFNKRVRKITARTGIITTVAGNGVADCSFFLDGNATSTGICLPESLAVDAAGSIYFCSSTLVRKVTYSEVTPSSAVTPAPSVTPVSSSTGSPTAALITPTSASAASARTGIISRIAGTKSWLPSTRVYGIAAKTAKFDTLSGLALDPAGNVFFATSGDVTLKVTARTGLVTLVAGTGGEGFNGDGALATSATLHYPCGIALDQFGNIFVADTFSHRIRKITLSTGIISTVAGSEGDYARSAVDNIAATSTTLNHSHDVAVDAFGNIYIADQKNFRVRKVTACTGTITSIAGSGKGGLSGAYRISPTVGVAATDSDYIYPYGVTADSSGNIFIADGTFNSIFKVAASTGLLTLVAGNNKRGNGYYGDGVPATTALLSRPEYLTVDAEGNIFFSDLVNDRVRKITGSTGIITTVAVVKYTDYDSCTSNEYDGDGKNATTVALCYAQGIAVDAAGSIYFCHGYVIEKVTYVEVTPSSAVTPAPSVTPVSSSTGSPTVATPQPISTPTPTSTSSVSITKPPMTSSKGSPTAATPQPIPTPTTSVSITKPPVSSSTGSPTAATPQPIPTPTPTTSVSITKPPVSSSTGSPTAATLTTTSQPTPQLTPSASLPTAPAISSAAHVAGARHLTIILLSSPLVLYFTFV